MKKSEPQKHSHQTAKEACAWSSSLSPSSASYSSYHPFDKKKEDQPISDCSSSRAASPHGALNGSAEAAGSIHTSLATSSSYSPSQASSSHSSVSSQAKKCTTKSVRRKPSPYTSVQAYSHGYSSPSSTTPRAGRSSQAYGTPYCTCRSSSPSTSHYPSPRSSYTPS